jgi:hypothetical protein
MKRLVPVTDYATVAKALYGDGAWEIAKALTPAEQKAKRERTQARVGLATNIVGLAAGGAALGSEIRNTKAAFAEGGSPKKSARHMKPTKLRRAASATGQWVAKNPKKLAIGALSLQAGNLAGDAIANRVLARSAKDPKKRDVSKSLGSDAKVRVLRKVEEKAPKVKIARNKGQDFTISATVSKAIEDKRQVYGWASITEMDGQPVVDLQGDYITIEEVEKAAHKYISKSRKGGDMHVRIGDDPKHVSDLIESVVITPEKKEALGLPPESPTGWWVGMQVHDEETWQLVKDGKRPMFSVHGSGRRQEMEIPA